MFTLEARVGATGAVVFLRRTKTGRLTPLRTQTGGVARLVAFERGNVCRSDLRFQAPEVHRAISVSARNLVSEDGIEPPTRGFSILCSTD